MFILFLTPKSSLLITPGEFPKTKTPLDGGWLQELKLPIDDLLEPKTCNRKGHTSVFEGVALFLPSKIGN